jgi:crossover junction endodeoxyribonuclease RuvC
MKNNCIRVLGIDPGLATTGIAVLEVTGNQYKPVFCNFILTEKDQPTYQRLKIIYESINTLILEYCPDCVAIEEIFFSANVKTALSIGQARGVSILAGSENNLKVYEYTPLQVKQALVGYGRATKKQMKYMLKIILGIKESPFPENDDAWDAMGIALCHASRNRFEDKVGRYLS